MKCQAFIFARGGSKGVPRKNIRMLGDKPMIAHAIDCARAAPSLGDVIVSTDDEEIARVARECGADVPFMRPDALAGDSAPEWLAWRHAVEFVRDNRGQFDAMVSLPTTSPFRAVEDVENCIAQLDRGGHDAVITVCEGERNPYFNMVVLDDAGEASLAIPPSTSVARRQDAPVVYNITTVAYAVKTDFVMTRDGLFQGRLGTVEIPRERAMDIDTPYDLRLAELLARDLMEQENAR